MVRKKPHPKPLESFLTKKSQILSAIAVPLETYTDKSPKGSIDAPIIELIQQINSLEGLVTTSSCSGRVAVFVEGPKTEITVPPRAAGDADHKGDEDYDDDVENDNEGQTQDEEVEAKALMGSPAGKGGGHWLYVSHDPVAIPTPPPPNFYTQLCGLSRNHDTTSTPQPAAAQPHPSPRLIKLSFSPLILHVLCANLHEAKDLLAAAINAGFRESGVQSLKGVDDATASAMVGIRTMGLGFETVVGVVRERADGSETYEALVAEEYLAVMFGVVNERFEWNARRRRRLSRQIDAVCRAGCETDGSWEDKEVRRRRKREEGLRRKMEVQEGKGAEGGEQVVLSQVGSKQTSEVDLGGIFTDSSSLSTEP